MHVLVCMRVCMCMCVHDVSVRCDFLYVCLFVCACASVCVCGCDACVYVHMCCSKLKQYHFIFDAKTVPYSTNKVFCNTCETVPYSTKTVLHSTQNRSTFNAKPFRIQRKTVPHSTQNRSAFNAKPFRIQRKTVPHSTHSNAKPFRIQRKTVPHSTQNCSTFNAKPFCIQRKTVPHSTQNHSKFGQNHSEFGQNRSHITAKLGTILWGSEKPFQPSVRRSLRRTSFANRSTNQILYPWWELEEIGCQVKYATGDTDRDIAVTAVNESLHKHVTVIGEDTDLLVFMLFYTTKPSSFGLIYRSDKEAMKNSKIYDKYKYKQKLKK